MTKAILPPGSYRELIRELAEDTRIALRPSPVHGIGVFAIADIPEGYNRIFSRPLDQWVRVPIVEIDSLPSHARDLVETYCVFDETHYWLPSYGMKVMDLVNYLNHSREPNIVSIEDGEHFQALRHISAGEELFVDYETIVKVNDY